ncbi:MAG TPA: serine/threonine-protein kinase [Polyangiaceae bacterium]
MISVLAFGGMGDVYEVEDTSVGRRFVLKTLQRELAGDGDLRRQMQTEARVLGRIDHVNVVRVFTSGTADDLPYIVMEKLEGATLRQMLRAGTRIPMRAAVRTVVDLLLALDHVHELGVVHCDLKPENVFFHRDRYGVTPKLLDFGVVRVLPRGEADAKLGGTLRYASPEQVRGEAVGPRSDVYAMGLVLYEMLAGMSPFRDATGPSQIARAQLERTPAPIAGIPSGLMRLVLRALAKDPAARPRDAFAFARELRDIEPTLEGERDLDASLIAARAKCDEITRVADEETVRDATMFVTNADLLTRQASGCGGGGRWDGFRP